MRADSSNLSVKKTQRSIKNAFIQLASKKPYSRITVRELAELAEVSVSTFYLHYHDIHELYDAIKDDLIDELMSCVPAQAVQGEAVPPYLNKRFAEIIEKNTAFFSSGDFENADVDLFDRLIKSARVLAEATLGDSNTRFDKNLCVDFLAAGFFGLYFYSLSKGSPISVERITEIALMCNNALLKGMS